MTALDPHALDAAVSAWHATYRSHPVTDRQQFEEAVAEATEDALAAYLRETRPVNGAPVTLADFLEPDDDELVPAGRVLHVSPWGDR